MEKISSVAEKERIPAEASRIQVNFCKNPACGNYGVLPRDVVIRGRGPLQDTYIIAAGPGKTQPRPRCGWDWPTAR